MPAVRSGRHFLRLHPYDVGVGPELRARAVKPVSSREAAPAAAEGETPPSRCVAPGEWRCRPAPGRRLVEARAVRGPRARATRAGRAAGPPRGFRARDRRAPAPVRAIVVPTPTPRACACAP